MREFEVTIFNYKSPTSSNPEVVWTTKVYAYSIEQAEHFAAKAFVEVQLGYVVTAETEAD